MNISNTKWTKTKCSKYQKLEIQTLSEHKNIQTNVRKSVAERETLDYRIINMYVDRITHF